MIDETLANISFFFFFSFFSQVSRQPILRGETFINLIYLQFQKEISVSQRRKYSKLHILRSICSNLQKRIPQNRNLELQNSDSIFPPFPFYILPTDSQAALFPSSTSKQLFHDKGHTPTTINSYYQNTTDTESLLFSHNSQEYKCLLSFFSEETNMLSLKCSLNPRNREDCRTPTPSRQ